MFIRGADINIANVLGQTPLLGAALNGSETVVDLLIHHHAVKPNHQTLEVGLTPLLAASQAGFENIVRILLSNDDTNINLAKSSNGDTPLHVAAYFGYEQVVKELLNRPDIKINAKNHKNLTPEIYAAMRGHLNIAKILMEKQGQEADIAILNNIVKQRYVFLSIDVLKE